jgi:hypothetical protein
MRTRRSTSVGLPWTMLGPQGDPERIGDDSGESECSEKPVGGRRVNQRSPGHLPGQGGKSSDREQNTNIRARPTWLAR